MKTKIKYSALLLLFTAFASAQISVGVLGGVNFQNMNGKNHSGDILENSMIPGFNAGVNIQIPVAPEFYFQPGLLFSTKGAQSQGSVLTTTTKLSYLELPLNFVYKGLLGNGYVLLGVGPYVGYAINGKVTTEGGSVSVDSPVKFQNVVAIGDSPLVPYYRALDAGGNIFIGYELKGGIFAQINAQLGMLDINPEYSIVSNDKATLKNTGFGVSLGYRF
jgi:hypothetical protein